MDEKIMITKVDILGTRICVLTMEKTINLIETFIQTGGHHYVCICPVSTIVACKQDDELRTIVNTADLATPDGMPLVWLIRLKTNEKVDRVYGPDLMVDFMNATNTKKYSHFFFGGKQDVPEKMAKKFTNMFSGLRIAGCYSPPFRSLSNEEENKEIEMINNATPDIVWVGIGSPKQEKWMKKNVSKLNAAVIIGVGAAFDFHSGVKKQAPLWLRNIGMEWFFRLLTEPLRLWRRYLVGNTLFVYWLIKEQFKKNRR
ncbi:MAG: WecB/TagA/CpsF family glycosyltransferase [Candidatus Omnitrophica bacterium]|nr:WecB/TagA/CpsF family glycosyltransferase [Candidatus Omnitrophota bacterium]